MRGEKARVARLYDSIGEAPRSAAHGAEAEGRAPLRDRAGKSRARRDDLLSPFVEDVYTR